MQLGFIFGGKPKPPAKTRGMLMPAALASVSAEEQQQTESKLNLIESFSDVPVGAYIALADLKRPPLPVLNASFAIIKKSEKVVCLLVAADVKGNRAQLDLTARLRADERFDVTLVFPATREVIRTVHEKFQVTSNVPDEVATDVQKATYKLIHLAASMGTSDIHIETRGDHAEVFFRINGKRIEQPNISSSFAKEMAGILYNVESADSARGTSWESTKVQDTSVDIPPEDGRSIQIRFHSAPIHPAGNIQIVMRLLLAGKAVKSIDAIGYTDDQRDAIDEMLAGGSGLLLIVGPTNSGKSSSLQSFAKRLFEMRGPTIKVSTIEAPVEYEMANACQMQASKDLFQPFLEASLRQDPDAVIVGEIRDSQGASVIKDLVLAGHKIMSTVHVYEAIAAFARLREMGVPLDLLTMPGFISGVIYQRLLPILCPHCSRKWDDVRDTGMLTELQEKRFQTCFEAEIHDVRFMNELGCEKCHHTGIVGRTPVAEIVRPDEIMLELIRKGDDSGARRQWMDNSTLRIDGLGVTALSHAISKMRAGIVDPRDVETYIGLLQLVR